MSDTVQFRINSKTKREVNAIFQHLGFDLSTGIRIYFQQVLRQRGIPFPLVTENGYTPEEEERLARESERTRKLYRSGRRQAHRSVQTMAKEIMST